MKNISQSKLPVGGRIGRIAKIIRDRTDLITAEKVMKDFEIFESPKNYTEKAQWIKEMIGRMENQIGFPKSVEIMESCGNKCCGVTTRKQAKKIMEESNSLIEFIEKLNEKGIGGGRLKLENDNTITGGYDRCYCGLVKQTKEPFQTKTYCQCSVGWYKQLFKSVFEKDIKVELVQTIIMGANSCEFIIHI